jgi:radical SAM superfamily enzyme YgiQ (UPF0313 family)
LRTQLQTISFLLPFNEKPVFYLKVLPVLVGLKLYHRDMADIVLTTFNAKYVHTAFGLRYLLANLGPIKNRAVLLEADIHQWPIDHAEAILAHKPRIVGFGVYIWNVSQTYETIKIIKTISPDTVVVLGGPEISYAYERHPLYALTDYIIPGEADLAFRELAQRILAGNPPHEKVFPTEPPDLAEIELPYSLYSDSDVQHRVIYVETTRGCPFKCQFCLSAIDHRVRYFPLDPVLQEIKRLIERGATKLKFVDRTFNVRLDHAVQVMEFLLANYRPGVSLHFEIVPDRLQPELIELSRKFPPGALRFELGIQTLNPEVASRIDRPQVNKKIIDTIRTLRESTSVHLHTDLIFGLPGETLESFATGFDQLVALNPHEIQVGILKRLPGAPIAIHDEPFQMRYNPNPPYEILSNTTTDFFTVQEIRRFARYWEIIWNSGRFAFTAPLIWAGEDSPFYAFLNFTRWLYKRVGRTDSIALPRLARLLFEYLTQVRGIDPQIVAKSITKDYHAVPRQPIPGLTKN